MSINLKPHSLECGRSFKVLDFGSSRKPKQTTHFSVWYTQGFLDFHKKYSIYHRESIIRKQMESLKDYGWNMTSIAGDLKH